MPDDMKKVDENWKNQIDREKSTADQNEQKFFQPTFKVFLSSMTIQAMIALGRLENPASGKSDLNLDQARFLIDTMGIIQEKTKGNLDQDETQLLEDSLFNLRMMYVEEKNKPGTAGEGGIVK